MRRRMCMVVQHYSVRGPLTPVPRCPLPRCPPLLFGVPFSMTVLFLVPQNLYISWVCV